mgnify:CR=1 FL=1
MIQWNLYQGALLPYVPPYEKIDVDRTWIVNEIKRRKALFARWTSDFDCGHPSEWWFCLRDKPIELSEFKSKLRNEINRGLKTTEFLLVDNDKKEEYVPLFFEIAKECHAEYPEKYRPHITLEVMRKNVEKTIFRGGNFWACIDKETSVMCGYCEVIPRGKLLNMTIVKVRPEYLRNRVNAGLVFTLCQYYLNSGMYAYLSDGQRNIRHETNYQAFLVKTLGFRYAYCRLNVVYHPLVNILVKGCYPFRSLIGKLSVNSARLYNLYCLLRQEEYARAWK